LGSILVRAISVTAAGFCLLSFAASPVCAQAVPVSEIVSQKDQWRKFAEEGQRLQFEGRFQGRAADAVQLDKFEVTCRLPSSIKLPDRMRLGQRLDVTGKFVLNEGKLSFHVSRLIIRNTDLEQITTLAATIPDDQPDQLLALADQYVSTAEFYGDKALKQEILSLRTRAVTQKRQAARGNVEQLRTVLALGESVGAEPSVLKSLQFEMLITEWQKGATHLDSLLNKVKELDGWDRQISEAPERIRSVFPEKAITIHDNGSADDRQWLHRLLYVAMRLQQIQAMLKPDGSNGLILAEAVRREFPGETAAAAALEEHEIRFQLGRVDSLSRTELQQLTQLLTKLLRKEKIPEVIAQWLTAQERRFGTENLPAMLRMADEHLFAAELLQDANYQTRGIDLLKQAWSLAAKESPQDAAQIADRLKRLGWEQLNGRWMTGQEMKMLPKDDIQLAAREGRVVPGMTEQQVVQTLGQPARMSRLGSSRIVRELWIYDSGVDSGLVIRFRRSLLSNADVNVVEDVSRISAARNR